MLAEHRGAENPAIVGQQRSTLGAQHGELKETHVLSHCAIQPAGSDGSTGSVGPESGETGGWGGVGAAMVF